MNNFENFREWTFDEYFDFLVSENIAKEEEVILVTHINGHTTDVLDDILYVRTGNRSIEQYLYDAYGYEEEEGEEDE